MAFPGHSFFFANKDFKVIHITKLFEATKTFYVKIATLKVLDLAKISFLKFRVVTMAITIKRR